MYRYVMKLHQDFDGTGSTKFLYHGTLPIYKFGNTTTRSATQESDQGRVGAGVGVMSADIHPKRRIRIFLRSIICTRSRSQCLDLRSKGWLDMSSVHFCFVHSSSLISGMVSTCGCIDLGWQWTGAGVGHVFTWLHRYVFTVAVVAVRIMFLPTEGAFGCWIVTEGF
jgi:hypothetical protein